MPNVVKEINSAWFSCIGYAVGWKDPPIALEPVASVTPPKLLTFVSAERESTADARAPTSAAVPGPLPSQVASSTTQRELPVRPTGSFFGPANTTDVNLIDTVIASEILNHFYRSNIPDSAFSGLDFNQPEA